MTDALSIIFIVVFLIVIVALFVGFMGSFGSSGNVKTSEGLMPPTKPPSDAPSMEGILGLIALGVIGVAAYKFIQSGGLRKLTEEVGKLTVDVNGQRKTIASAMRDDSYIEQLLNSVIERKMRQVLEAGRPVETLGQDTPKAAADVAHMLQDALEARMRREGLY